ncbi:MAG: hypothetical protein ABW039_02910 [Sphingobium sp.]
MSDMRAWSMDRLAAVNLLADLGQEPTPDNLAKATRHFADHRHHAIGWAAERVHGAIIDRLEASAASSDFRHDSAERGDGFRLAQQQVMTVRPRDLLQLAPDQQRSRGQILRGLVRRARGR